MRHNVIFYHFVWVIQNSIAETSLKFKQTVKWRCRNLVSSIKKKKDIRCALQCAWKKQEFFHAVHPTHWLLPEPAVH